MRVGDPEVVTSKIDNNEKLFIKMPVIVSGLIIGVVASGSVLLVKYFFLGNGFTVFVSVILDRPPEYRTSFLEKIAELQEIQECHHVAGDYDYLLKVRCKNTRHFDHVVSTELRGLQGVIRFCKSAFVGVAPINAVETSMFFCVDLLFNKRVHFFKKEMCTFLLK